MNETETKMVEINLTWDATIGVPTADENGNLTWERKWLHPYDTYEIKVKVPEEATKSRSDLIRYLETSAERWDADVLEIDSACTNIWNEEKNEFLF